jgi:hypothetical protein
MKETVPRLEPIAPIVDRMLELAEDHLPDRCTCRVKLYEDGTYRTHIEHVGVEEGSYEYIGYFTATSEIVHVNIEGTGEEEIELTGDESIHQPTYDTYEVTVLEQVEPPEVRRPVGR